MNRNLYGLGDYNTAQVRTMALEVEKEGMDPTPMYRRRPDAASEPKAVIKEMPISEAAFIIPDTFAGNKGSEIVAGFSLSQLEKIGSEGDQYLRGAIMIALEIALKASPEDEHLKELAHYVDFSPAWQE